MPWIVSSISGMKLEAAQLLVRIYFRPKGTSLQLLGLRGQPDIRNF